MGVVRSAALGAAMAIAAATSAPAAESGAALVGRVSSAVAADQARLVAIYKDLHANPELGFQETRTAGILAEQLRGLGYEVTTGVGKTGLLAVMENGPGPVLMYRADMDALPQRESTGLPYASKKTVTRPDGSTVPVAHLCGHDLHSTWMLGVAKVLAERREDWSGTVAFVAQPSEETVTGARAMVDDGLYARHGAPKPDFLLAAHTFPVELGFVAASEGLLMAGTQQLDVTFHGVGGHGSTPHLAKDPIVMASAAILQYQTIVSRSIDPRKTAVLTVGSFRAGATHNVIPPEARLQINLRFFDKATLNQLIEGVDRINKNVARAFGMPEDRLP